MRCENDTHREFLSEISRIDIKIMGNEIGSTCSTHVEIINGFTVLVVKPEGRIQFRILKDCSRIALRETSCDDVDWAHLTQGLVQ